MAGAVPQIPHRVAASQGQLRQGEGHGVVGVAIHLHGGPAAFGERQGHPIHGGQLDEQGRMGTGGEAQPPQPHHHIAVHEFGGRAPRDVTTQREALGDSCNQVK
jgi:hypothetical protein